MSDTHTRVDPADGDPPGQPPSAADLHDAITRHLDGGLDVDAQRVLARRLAASPEARRLLAGHLRIEAALVRLGLAGQLGPAAAPVAGAAADEGVAVAAAVSPAPEPPAPAPGRRRAWRSVATDLAIAAAALVALTLTLTPWRAAGPGRTAGPGGGEMDRVAAQWLLVARDPGPLDTDTMAAVADEAGDDAVTDPPDESAAGPPAWLVAAMADEEFQRVSPDAG